MNKSPQQARLEITRLKQVDRDVAKRDQYIELYRTESMVATSRTCYAPVSYLQAAEVKAAAQEHALVAKDDVIRELQAKLHASRDEPFGAVSA